MKASIACLGVLLAVSGSLLGQTTDDTTKPPLTTVYQTDSPPPPSTTPYWAAPRFVIWRTVGNWLVGVSKFKNSYWQPIVCGVGLLLNLMVILIFGQKKRRRQYVSAVLISLALSDSVFLAVTLASQHGYWYNNSDFCCKLLNYYTSVSKVSSLYFVLLFTFERYVSVRFPLKWAMICSRRRMLFGILGVVLFVHALEAYNIHLVAPRKNFFGSSLCLAYYYRGAYHRYMRAVFGYVSLVLDSVIGMLLPCVLIAVLNSRLLLSLKTWETAKQDLGEQSSQEKEKTEAAQKSLTVMLVAVSSFSLITMLPHMIYSVMYYFWLPPYPYGSVRNVILDLTKVLRLLNYSCNFFFYVLGGGRQLRSEFVTVITCGKGKVTCGRGKVTCGKGKVTCGKGKVTRGKGKVTCGKGKVTCGKGNVTCGKGKVTCGKGK